MDDQDKVSVKNKSKKKKLIHKWWFWVIVAFCVIIVFSAIVGSDDSGETSAESSTEKSAEKQTVVTEAPINEEAYKQSCEYESYFQLSHYPDNYIGKDLYTSGEVVQVIEEGNDHTILVNVTKNEYGLYEDTVYVTYTRKSSDPRILEGDRIAIYGRFEGLVTYTTVIGENVSVPGIDAKFIKIY